MRANGVRWAAVIAAATLMAAGAVRSGEPVRPAAWLLLGPAPAPLPAFHDEKPGGQDAAHLLETEHLGRADLRPRSGEAVPWIDGTSLTWREVPAPAGGLGLGAAEGSQVAWLAASLRAERFTEVDLVVRSHHLLLLAVDGRVVARKKAATSPPGTDDDDGAGKKKKKKDEGGPEPGEAKAKLDLEPGVHRVLVKALRDPGCPFPWAVAAELTPPEGAAVSWSTSPDHPLELAQVLDAPQPSGVAISPDGALAAITVSRIVPGTHDSESWLEVRRVADGGLERTWRGAKISGVDWGPSGRRLSYVTRDDKKATLWVADLETGGVEPIVERVEKFGSYEWSPDGGSVFYSASFEPEKDESGVQRLLGLQDRQADWRERSYLFQASVPGGVRRRLTAGELSTGLDAIAPDGRRVLFTRTRDDYTGRPYVRQELWVLDLVTLEPRLLDPGWFLSTATWSPDGGRLLVTGGPSAFGGAGRAVPEGTTPNDYDGQIYLLDPATGDVEPLSREFDPSVERAFWHRGDGKIYLQVTEGSRVGLYRLDPASRRYERLETGVDVVGDLALAASAPVAVYTGSDAAAPPRVVALDLAGGEPRVLDVPGAEAFADVRMEEVRDWSFESRRDATIEGRIHLPPDFDPARRYPLIVYYYGGTSPTSREFGGRYPKSWWAANGYVVYVLQPSGATGYGQAFSALHVNDWGRIAGGDILEGVEKFVQAHPFVDPERIGCIGASYGGFMTQYLLTKTDRFTAAVSHAGISFLGSYWGEGYWGYAYSGVATAEAFPWDRGDLYVGSSPLFHADRIRTPLLLLHGTGDVNVPPGESEQLYTALKLLGREVEYVRIEGQDHHILKHEQRVLWSKTILAWFDRWLKEDPAWWDHLYPDPAEEDEEDKEEEKKTK
jgi:dipeptidyl aminopeptidase/acylaminoacyl peptidase